MSLSARAGLAVVLALTLAAVLPAFAGDAQGDNVVVTKPGVVFHKSGSTDIRGRGTDRTIDAALEAGYTPCPICFAKEIAAARGVSPDLKGGSSMATFAGKAQGVPDPPVSNVTQPFGLRVSSTRFNGYPRDAIRNPYDELMQVIPGRYEQGAFGER